MAGLDRTGGCKLDRGGNWDENGASRLAPELFASAGVKPEDIDVVGFYDHFSPVIITKLEVKISSPEINLTFPLAIKFLFESYSIESA